MCTSTLIAVLDFCCTFASQVSAQTQVKRKPGRRSLAIFVFPACALSALSPVLVAQTITVVSFDDPSPAGPPGSLLNGVFQSINFGTGQWRWSGPYFPDPTNHIYFDSSFGTFRTFSFATGPRVLNSMTVYAMTAGTLTLSDNLGQTVTQSISPGSLQP